MSILALRPQTSSTLSRRSPDRKVLDHCGTASSGHHLLRTVLHPLVSVRPAAPRARAQESAAEAHCHRRGHLPGDRHRGRDRQLSSFLGSASDPQDGGRARRRGRTTRRRAKANSQRAPGALHFKTGNLFSSVFFQRAAAPSLTTHRYYTARLLVPRRVTRRAELPCQSRLPSVSCVLHGPLSVCSCSP